MHDNFSNSIQYYLSEGLLAKNDNDLVNIPLQLFLLRVSIDCPVIFNIGGVAYLSYIHTLGLLLLGVQSWKRTLEVLLSVRFATCNRVKKKTTSLLKTKLPNGTSVWCFILTQCII